MTKIQQFQAPAGLQELSADGAGGWHRQATTLFTTLAEQRL